MSVKTDVVNLQINVNGNKAQAELGTLRKRAADLNFEMKGLKKNTEEYNKKAADLKQVTARMDELKKSIGLTSLTMKELIREQQRLNQLRSQTVIGSKDFQMYSKQLEEVQGRLAQVRQGSVAAQSTLAKAGNFIKGAGIAVLAGGIAAAGAATIEFFSQTIAEAEEAEQKLASFETTLKAVGKSDAFERLAADAEDLAGKLGFFGGDDLYVVYEKLLTYGKLTQLQIRNLTPVIVDFAAKNKISFEQAAESIIGALEGQGKAMKQYGIDIKEGANVTERLGIIMTDLASKVDGAAESFGSTKEGKLLTEMEKFKSIQEEIGKTTGPLWLDIKTSILESVQGIIQTISSAGNYIRRFYLGVTDLKALREEDKKGQIDKLNENATQNARSFLKSVQGFSIEELKAELLRQKALLKADGITTLKRPTIQNEANLLKSQLIVKGLEEEIQLIKERNALADKRELTPEEKAAAKAEAAYQKRIKAMEDFMKRSAKLTPAEIEKAAEELDLPIKINVKYETDPQKIRESLQRTSDALLESNLEFLSRRKASLELKVSITNGREQLDNVIASLETEQAARIALAEQTGEEVADIEEYYRQAKIQAITDSFIAETEQYLQYAQAAASILDAWIQNRNQKDQQELQKFKRQSDQKKKIEEQRLKSGLVSQAQYNKKVTELDEQYEKKQRELAIKQFKRNQKLQIVNANINIAQAVLQALAGSPPPANYILAAAVGIAGLIQLNTIRKQQPPEAKKGLIIPGNTRHTDGGIDLYDRKENRVIANVESGEPLWVFSRDTYRNNKPILDQLMYNSQNKSGASILPSFKQAYRPINSGKLVPIMQNGGIVSNRAGQVTGAAEMGIEINSAILQQIAGLREDMSSWKARLKAEVSYFEIEDKQQLLQDAKAASGLNQ